MKNQCRIKTTIKNPTIRLLFVAIAFLIINIWIYLVWHYLSRLKRSTRQVFSHLFTLKQKKRVFTPSSRPQLWGSLRSLFTIWLILVDFRGLFISKSYYSHLTITFCTFPKKRYHTLLFFSDRRSFRSTEFSCVSAYLAVKSKFPQSSLVSWE